MQEVELYNSSGEELYQLAQWDKDVYITIKAQTTVFTGTGTCQIHFFSSASEQALVVNGNFSVVNGIISVTCKIPNKILTEPYAINGHVVMYYGSGNEEIRGTYKFRINILKRPQPSDYIYTESDDYVALASVIAQCEGYASNAADSAEDAATSEANALAYKNDASASEANALEYKNSANNSANAAAQSLVATNAYADTAREYANSAQQSAEDAAAYSGSNLYSIGLNPITGRLSLYYNGE